MLKLEINPTLDKYNVYITTPYDELTAGRGEQSDPVSITEVFSEGVRVSDKFAYYIYSGFLQDRMAMARQASEQARQRMSRSSHHSGPSSAALSRHSSTSSGSSDESHASRRTSRASSTGSMGNFPMCKSDKWASGTVEGGGCESLHARSNTHIGKKLPGRVVNGAMDELYEAQSLDFKPMLTINPFIKCHE